MYITVAICTWNRYKLLAQTLERLTQLVVPVGVTWELIVVDNNCSDTTADVIKSFTPRLPMRAVVEPIPGVSVARNTALNSARGNYLTFIDDDVLPEKQWLGAIAEAAARYPFATVFGGPIEPWFPVPLSPSLVEMHPVLRVGFCGLDHERPEGPLPPELSIGGANMALKLSALQGVRFDPALGPAGTCTKLAEDYDLITRLRRRGDVVIWCPRMKVAHYVDPSRLRPSALRRRYEGKGQTMIRLEGLPTGTQVVGVPLVVLTGLVGSFLRFSLWRLLLRRRLHGKWMETHYRFRGMVKECRAIRLESPRRNSSSSHSSPYSAEELRRYRDSQAVADVRMRLWGR